MFVAASFPTGKRPKPPSCPSTEGWVNTLRYVHRLEYYSPLKKGGILIHAITWKNLKDIVFCENKPGTKDQYCMRLTRVIKCIETEGRMGVARSWGQEEWELLFNRCRVPVLQDEKSPGDGWWHNSVTVLNASEPPLLTIQHWWTLLWVFHHTLNFFFKLKTKKYSYWNQSNSVQ